MGFRQAATGTAPARTVAPAGRTVPARNARGRGRYAGIRMASDRGPDKIKQGDYIIEFVRSGASRKGQTLMVTALVIDNNDDVHATKNGEQGLIMINIGGDAYDIGFGTIKRLTGIVWDCETDDDLDDAEAAGELKGVDGQPGDWGDFIDAMFGEANGVAVFGQNPLAKQRVIAVIRNSAQLDEKGVPFQNVAFEAIEEESSF